MRSPLKPFYALVLLIVIFSCKHSQEDNGSINYIPEKVKVVPVDHGSISSYRQLNATSTFLKDHLINAPVSGYIIRSNCVTGDITHGNEILFEIKTREAAVLDRSGDEISSKLNIKGVTEITSGVKGYIKQVMHQEGDFVAEGEPLASIKETGSLVFILNLPYEWNDKIKLHMPVSLLMPDSTIITGYISNISVAVDPVSQTQRVYIKTKSNRVIPENLTATVLLPIAENENTQKVPRPAVLSNETETRFWIMKMINDTTAVKVMIHPGIRNNDSIEVVRPVFAQGETVLLTGNYAVPDTVYVNVIR